MKQQTTLFEKGLIAAGFAAAGGLLFAFYTLVASTQEPMKREAPLAVVHAEQSSVDEASAVSSLGPSGRLLIITASFDATAGAKLTWEWAEGNCAPSFPERRHVSGTVKGNESFSQTWSQCLSAENPRVVVLDRSWYPTAGSGGGVVEGKMLLVDAPVPEKGPDSVFFAALGGLCESEDGPCSATLQVGASASTSTVSLTLPGGNGEHRFFAQRKSAVKKRPLLADEYEELTAPGLGSDGEESDLSSFDPDSETP